MIPILTKVFSSEAKKYLCVLRTERSRSDCADAQSDQGLHCPQNPGYYRLFQWRANARMRLHVRDDVS